jgi:ribose 1,5-bisphosphokinase
MMDAVASTKACGVFVAVVGPSGVGKDSIMRLAAEMLTGDERIHFVRRVITRAENADEAHDTLNEAEFLEASRAGRFAVHWSANGLHYGIPISVCDEINAGKVVVANASRDKANEIKHLFAKAIIVHITASVETLRARLLARGREDVETVDIRLARSLMLEQGFTADIRIENNGALESATKQFINAVLALSSQQAKPHNGQALGLFENP